jgi:hypothetical protein
MKLTTTTNVSVDGVMQGLGAPDEDRRSGFEPRVRKDFPDSAVCAVCAVPGVMGLPRR